MQGNSPLPVRLTLSTLTAPQAKGLEFDDVYLINFFEDSEAGPEWRVLCSFLEKIKEEEASGLEQSGTHARRHRYKTTPVHVPSSEAGHLRPVEFDRSKHTLLQEELKVSQESGRDQEGVEEKAVGWILSS